MEFAFLPDSFGSWVSLITMAGFGILAGLNIFDRVGKARRVQIQHGRDEADNVETRLVNALKDEVDVLTRRSEKQDFRLLEMEKTIIKITTENSTLRDVLSGRDSESANYREQGLATMKLVHEMAKMMPVMQRDIKELYTSINKHLSTVERFEKKRA